MSFGGGCIVGGVRVEWWGVDVGRVRGGGWMVEECVCGGWGGELFMFSYVLFSYVLF